jgi:methyl-accepting chemotaxis protein
MENNNNRHTGKKILYTIVIVICSLIVLLNAAGIIGVWMVQRPITDTAVNILRIVHDTSGTVRQGISRVDDTLAILEAGTTEIAKNSQQLSQNVTDKGLVMVLLPEEKEQQLSNNADEIKVTFEGVRESIAKGMDLYRSVNSLPFVSLPILSNDQMGDIESTVTNIQDSVSNLRSTITDFRSGVSGGIDKVEITASNLSSEIGRGRESLDQLDTKLVALELQSNRLQEVIPCLLVILAVLLSVILAFVIFTQVEVIRLYVARWQLLSQPQDISKQDLQVETVDLEEVESKSE